MIHRLYGDSRRQYFERRVNIINTYDTNYQKLKTSWIMKISFQNGFHVKIQYSLLACAVWFNINTAQYMYAAYNRLSSISRSCREDDREINCGGPPLLPVWRAFREKKAMSNWPIAEQTDIRAAFDGRQSTMLSAPLFSGSIAFLLFFPYKAYRISLYYASR